MNTMNTEQREEIETLLSEIEKQASPDRMPHASGAIWASALLPLVQFARQQLTLRVDGQKFMERFIDSNLISPQCVENDSHGIVVVWSSCAPEQLEALVLECLTTTPEEKE